MREGHPTEEGGGIDQLIQRFNLYLEFEIDSAAKSTCQNSTCCCNHSLLILYCHLSEICAV